MTKPFLTTITAKPAPEETQTCWSCGTMRAVHFCESCGKVQPPAPVDYFTFFGLPRKLTLDVAVLDKDFYELSRRLHPDINARAGSQEQEWSLQQSSRLNDAHRTLKDPIKRTQYLLKLEGVELEEQSKSATERARSTGELKKQIVPPDLLEEVFELSSFFGTQSIAFGQFDQVTNACQRFFRGTERVYLLGRFTGNDEVNDFVAGSGRHHPCTSKPL